MRVFDRLHATALGEPVALARLAEALESLRAEVADDRAADFERAIIEARRRLRAVDGP